MRKRGSLFRPGHVLADVGSCGTVNTCAETLRERSELAKTLLLQALLDTHQSKSLRVKLKEPVELEPLRKIEEIRRFSNKSIVSRKKQW